MRGLKFNVSPNTSVVFIGLAYFLTSGNPLQGDPRNEKK